MAKYNVAIIGCGWAATTHIGVADKSAKEGRAVKVGEIPVS